MESADMKESSVKNNKVSLDNEFNNIQQDAIRNRIQQIDNRCNSLSKTIDNNIGQSEGLEAIYQSLMDERDSLVKRRNELKAK